MNPAGIGIDLLCMGEPMLEFSRLPAGPPSGPDGRVLFLEGHGGDTSNAAIAAARQGARVGYITALGEDMAGESFLRLWAREGVDTSFVARMADAQTGVYFITHDTAGAHQFHHYRTGSAASRFMSAHLPEAALAAARMFYVSGISQGISTSCADAVFRAIEIVKAHGGKLAYDTNYRPRLWPPARAAAVMHAAMAQADVALPGLEDAFLLTGLRDPDAIVDFYLRLGAPVVVLKMGADGALLATAEGRHRIPPLPIKLVDASGAGDTFCGAFLARILAGDAPLVAARYANAAAALACEGLGCVAPIPTAAQVAAAMERFTRESFA